MRVPLLSCVVAAYNAERTLARTLGSLHSVSLPIEVLIINDGSTDSTQEIAEAFCKMSPAFRLLTQENQGLGAVRNRGVQEATGKYVTFCDSDDIFLLENQFELARIANEADCELACGTGFSLISNSSMQGFWDDYTIRQISSTQTNENQKNFLKFLLQPTACTKLFLKAFILENELRFAEGLLFEDVIFTSSTLLKVEKLVVEPIPLFIYNVHNNGSITSDRSCRRFEIFRAISELIPMLTLSKLPGSQIASLAISLMRTTLWCLDNVPANLLIDFKRLIFDHFMKLDGKTKLEDWVEIKDFLLDSGNQRSFQTLVGLYFFKWTYENFNNHLSVKS